MRIRLPSFYFGSIVLALLCSPAPTYACSKAGFLGVRLGRDAHFIAVPTPDTVYAGAGTVKYVVAPGHFGPRGDRRIYGQILRVEQIGGLAAPLLQPNVTEVVVVPWDYSADCTPVPWTRSSVWLPPNERGLLTATLRDSAFWANGIPTFDVHTPDMQPYPQRAAQQMRRRNAPPDTLMSIEDLFSLMEILPAQRELADSPERAVEPLFHWARANPELARRYPAVAALRRARSSVIDALVRGIRSPLVGTYRLSFRVDEGPERAFYVRSQAIPAAHWSGLLEPPPQSDDPTVILRPPGYYLRVTGALNPSDLPDTCNPNVDPRNYKDGYIAVLDQSPSHTPEGLQWMGKVELDLLTRVFKDDAELRTFVKDEFYHTFERLRQGMSRTDNLPARFTQAGSGAIWFEQTTTLAEGRRIVITGERISNATVSCNPR